MTEQKSFARTVVFTSIAANYLPKARVLAKSVRRHHPDATFVVALADKWPEDLRLEDEPFDQVIVMEDLETYGLAPDRMPAWIFCHLTLKYKVMLFIQSCDFVIQLKID